MVIEPKDYHQEISVLPLDLLLPLTEKFSYMVAFLKTEVDTHSLIKRSEVIATQNSDVLINVRVHRVIYHD